MKRSLAIVAAVLLALCLAGTPATADAKQLKAARPATTCSLPYVDDANPYGAGRYIVTLTVCGNAKGYQMKVTDAKTGKRAKVTKHKRNVWTAVIKRGSTYRIQARAKGGTWRTVRYGIES